MTRERAIEVLDRWAGFGSPDEEYARVGFEANINDVEEAHDMASTALREQEERSKGCPYCLYLEPLCRPHGDVVAIETDGKQYVIEGDYWSFGIKFCPMCGRKLEVEE